MDFCGGENLKEYKLIVLFCMLMKRRRQFVFYMLGEGRVVIINILFVKINKMKYDIIRLINEIIYVNLEFVKFL